jgi:putative ABC transport system permease protein
VFRAAIRSLFARKVRLLLTGLSVVLGVGFMAGTYVLTGTMTSAFNALVDTGYSSIDVLVRSSNAFTAQSSSLDERESMPGSVLDDVAAVPGVAQAIGDVLGYAQIVDPATGKVIGTFGPPTAASAWNDLNGFTLEPGGSPPQGSDQVVIDASTAEGHDIQVGDRVEILFEGPPGEFEVVGIAGYGRGEPLRRPGRCSTSHRAGGARQGRPARFRLGRRGGDRGRTNAGSPVLPDGTRRSRRGSDVQAQDRSAPGSGSCGPRSSSSRSLFVGAFIIFNTFAIIVAQRTRELALFRALGASGRQVMTSVVVEAVVIGLVSSALGVLFGIGIAILLKGALNAIGFEIPASGTVLLTRTFIVSIVVGTVVTVIAALVPARRAARVAVGRCARPRIDPGARSGSDRLRRRRAGSRRAALTGCSAGPRMQFVGIEVALTFIGVAMLAADRPSVAAGIGLPIRQPRTGQARPGELDAEPRRTARPPRR